MRAQEDFYARGRGVATSGRLVFASYGLRGCDLRPNFTRSAPDYEVHEASGGATSGRERILVLTLRRSWGFDRKARRVHASLGRRRFLVLTCCLRECAPIRHNVGGVIFRPKQAHGFGLRSHDLEPKKVRP